MSRQAVAIAVGEAGLAGVLDESIAFAE